MNLNLYDSSHDREYELFRDTTEELINMYGVPVKYLITEKINQNEIFGEWSHLKIDNQKVHQFFGLPSASDNWEGDNSLFSNFGLQNVESINIFIPRKVMEVIHPEIVNRDGKATIENLPIGNLVVFESNKIMEVTGFELSSADFGNNNVFTSDRLKNVFKLKLKSYIPNRDDYSSADDITDSNNFDYGDFGNLDSIFRDEEEEVKNVTHKAEDVVLKNETIYPAEVREKPIREKTKEDNPFGYLG